MAKDLLLPGNIIGLHRKAVEKLSKSGNGDAALLYLCLAAGQTSGRSPGARSGWRPPAAPSSSWACSARTRRWPPSGP